MSYRLKRSTVQNQVNWLNERAGLTDVQWDTPGALFLEGYRPDTKRIYSITRNGPDGKGGLKLVSGSLRDVHNFLEGVSFGRMWETGK